MRWETLFVAAVLLVCARIAAATPMTDAETRTLGRAILAQLISIDTTAEHGDTTPAAEAMAERFRAAGFPAADINVVGASDHNKNLVVRFRGRGERPPLLLIAHLDVVEAKKSDWSKDPFALTEEGGYFYGRGTLDIKSGAATLVTALLRMKHDGVVPRGDEILALTAGEESGRDNGVQYLLEHRRDLIEAPLCFNQDAGGGELRGDRHVLIGVQTAEKVYVAYSLTTRNPGGHSSQPRADNAIYSLAAALGRLQKLVFPARAGAAVRGYFSANAKLQSGDLARDMAAAADPNASAAVLGRMAARSPYYNALLRTTCTPTMLSGGHAENALPQTASAVVNCRVLPDDDIASIETQLRAALADPAIEIMRTTDPKPSPPSPVDPAVIAAIAKAAKPVWGDLPVVPFMETGATDGLYLRAAGMPVYGFWSGFADVDDNRAHGRDERILAGEYYKGLDFSTRLLSAW